MHKIFLALTAALAWSATALADKAPAATGAAKVVNEAITAAGGEAVLKKYKGVSMKMKGGISVMGLDLEFDGAVLAMLPDKYRIAIDTGVMGQKINIVQVLNGKKMKATMNGMEIPVDDNLKEQLTSSVAEMEVGQLVPLLDEKKYKLKSGDDVDVDGKKTDVVIVNSVEGPIKDMKLFFDKKSHLLLKTQRKSKDETGQDIDEESYFTDYKKVQDLMTPHKGVVKHDGKEFMNFTISEVKHLEKIDDKEFATDD